MCKVLLNILKNPPHALTSCRSYSLSSTHTLAIVFIYSSSIQSNDHSCSLRGFFMLQKYSGPVTATRAISHSSVTRGKKKENTLNRLNCDVKASSWAGCQGRGGRAQARQLLFELPADIRKIQVGAGNLLHRHGHYCSTGHNAFSHLCHRRKLSWGLSYNPMWYCRALFCALKLSSDCVVTSSAPEVQSGQFSNL